MPPTAEVSEGAPPPPLSPPTLMSQSCQADRQGSGSPYQKALSRAGWRGRALQPLRCGHCGTPEMHRPGPPHRRRSPLPSRRPRLRPTGHSPPSPAHDSEDTPRPRPSPRLTCVSAAGRRSGRTCWGSNPHPHPHAHASWLRVAASQTGSAYCEMVGGVSLGSQSDGGVANTASSVPLPRPAPPPPPRMVAKEGLSLAWVGGACKPRPLLPTGTTSGMDSGVHGVRRGAPLALSTVECCPWNVPPLAGPGLSALRWTVHPLLVCGCDRSPSPGPLPACARACACGPCRRLWPLAPQGLLQGRWALLHGQGTGEGLLAARSLGEPRPPGDFVQGSLGLETPWRWRWPPTPTQSAFFSSWSPKYKWGLGRGSSLRTPCPHLQM